LNEKGTRTMLTRDGTSFLFVAGTVYGYTYDAGDGLFGRLF